MSFFPKIIHVDDYHEVSHIARVLGVEGDEINIKWPEVTCLQGYMGLLWEKDHKPTHVQIYNLLIKDGWDDKLIEEAELTMGWDQTPITVPNALDRMAEV